MRDISRWARVASATVVVCGLAAACGSSSKTASSASNTTTSPSPASSGSGGSTGSGAANSSLSPVTIGWVANDQGTLAQPASTDAALAATKYINAQLGGVDGHPLKLETCSVGLDSASNQQCGQQFANDSVDMVVEGPVFNASAFYSAMSASKKPIVGTVAISQADLTSNAFIWSSGQTVNAAYGLLAKKVVPNLTSVGVIELEGTTAAPALYYLKQGLGPNVTVKSVNVNPTSSDLTGAINQLGKVQLYVLSVTGPIQLEAASAIQSYAPGTPVITTQDLGLIAAQQPSETNNWYFVDTQKAAAVDSTDPQVKTFLANYPKYGDAAKYLNDPWASADWGLILTVQSVLAKAGAGNLSPASVTSALQAFTGPVIMGPDTVKCPGTVYASLCTGVAFAYQVKNGKTYTATAYPTIDVAPLNLKPVGS